VTPAEDANKQHALPVLGGEEPQPTANELGLCVIPADADGTVRRYLRKIPAADGPVDSLPWAVTKAFCREVLADTTVTKDVKVRCQELLDSESSRKYHRPLLVAFSERPRVLPVSHLLQIAATDGWQNNPTFRNGIVMLGGTFALSKDISYVTPLGTRAGVELFADAIETELQHRPVSSLNETLMVALELIGGYCLALWHFVSKDWRAVALRILVVPVLAVALSFFSFSSLAYWFNFIPVLAGVSIHEFYEHFKHHRKLVREIDAMQSKLRQSPKRRTRTRREKHNR